MVWLFALGVIALTLKYANFKKLVLWLIGIFGIGLIACISWVIYTALIGQQI